VPQCTFARGRCDWNVVCNFPQLAPGNAQFTLVVRAGTSTPLNNTASLPPTASTNGANNSSTALPLHRRRLTITKTDLLT